MVTGPADRMFNYGVMLVLGVIGIVAIFPMLYIVSVSLTPYTEVIRNGGYIVIPRDITFQAYYQLFNKTEITVGFKNSSILVVLGTLINLVGILSVAYPLSRKNLPGRSFFLLMIVFTMLFNGGLIPTYLVVRGLGLLDTLWALIIPGAIVTFHVLIMKTFFENLPLDLFESAKIDGAGEFRTVMSIVIPLSIPVLITIGLFNMVTYWNLFFQAILYITDPGLQPLQVILRKILLEPPLEQAVNVDEFVPTVTMQMAAVVLSSLPMIVIYPFIQKYFTQGMLIGAIKG